MRLEPLPQERLDDTQCGLDALVRQGVSQHLRGFRSERADGALIGPFIPMLHFPAYGKPVWDLVSAPAERSVLPKSAHEVAILVTGERFSSQYEIYAHEGVAARAQLAKEKVAAIAAGCRPADLTADEAAAHDVAFALTHVSQLPESTYKVALASFGREGVAELVFLVGAYALVSMLLNGFDVSVPGREEGL